MSRIRRITTVLGARPQFIKASVVSRALRSVGIVESVVHTGQHFDRNMSDVFFSELGMEAPEYSLDIHGGSHGEMTGRMLAAIERVLLSGRSDAVLVYGDTNSTLAGALAAIKLHIPVAHVEAGLRSFNMRMPEEINRIVTDRVSRWLFTPTEAADTNLRSEGVDIERIIRVGDVMFDVAMLHGRRARERSTILQSSELAPGEYALITIHRAENTDDPDRLRRIADALLRVATCMKVVLPLHPRTRTVLHDLHLLSPLQESVTVLQPAGYLDMVQLEQHAAVIATDSGGVQKEAFFHSVPCVTLRDETEWVELIQSGWNRLAPMDDAAAIAACIQTAAGTRGRDISPYGTGHAAEQIASALDASL